MPIPVYLKTQPVMARPADPEYYMLAKDGLYFCRNHPFFQSDVPARHPPRSLADHESQCQLSFPKLSRVALEYIVGFFDRVFKIHRSESVVLLLWNMDKQHYKLVVPEQEATVSESYGGRSPLDVRYQVPPLPPRHLLVGDIHCHGDIGAYASFTDRQDEKHRDGFHGIIGRIEREPPEFHLEMSVDGHRFPVQFDDIFEGYERRRDFVHPDWLKRVSVKVERPWSSRSYVDSRDWYATGKNKKRWD